MDSADTDKLNNILVKVLLLKLKFMFSVNKLEFVSCSHLKHLLKSFFLRKRNRRVIAIMPSDQHNFRDFIHDIL